MLVRRGVLFLVCVLLCTAAIKEKVTRNVVVTAEEEKIRDAAGYAAIAEIHREMDDDRSGSIDRKETSGFMTEDMHMRSSDRLRRENVFHGTDDAITVDDLWEAWFESEERAWTNEQVLYWVVHVINLPMYADMITKTKVDGKILPRLAVHNSTLYMSQELGIKSSVHRQKLRLNALDVVLFGFRETYSKTKDIALAFLLLLLTSVIILYARQRQRARLQVTELSSRLTQLKSMECEFEDVQKKWNEERNKRSTSDGGVNNGEIENLRIQLEEAERRLEEGGSGGNTPLALQPLLRRTCESEMAFMEKQRQECFIEMKEAIEMVNRLQKKQGSVLSSLKLATGASTASDQVDSKIFVIKSRMEKIHALSRDTQERWMQIESLCGFPILYMNETTAGGMYHTQATSHYYNTNSGSSSVSSMSLGNGNGSAHATNSTTTAMRTTTPVVVQQKVAAFQAARDTDAVVFAAADAARVPVVRMVPVVHSESAPALPAEDSQSLNSIETKKRRGFMKLNIFKKSPSKASMLSNGVAASNGNGH